MKKIFSKFKKTNLLKSEVFYLLLLILIGGYLRAYNLNWDLGHNFHPDERNIDAAVSRVHFFDQMDPQFFAYGGFPIYLYRAVGELVSFITKDPDWVYQWGQINLVGRSVSAFFATLTIPAIYILTKKLFSKRVAAHASLVAVFVPSFIQTSHFGITENFLVFSALLLAYLSINLYERPLIKNFIKSGLVWGLAVSAKTTSLSFVIFPATAFLQALPQKVRSLKAFIKMTLRTLIFLILGALTFTLFSPYTFLSWGKFMESMNYEYGVATGLLPVPYSLQFTQTTPYFFQIKNLIFLIGPIAYLSALGILLILIDAIRKKQAKYIIVIIFPLAYFAYVGAWHTKFVRFMLPILPFIIIFSSYALYYIKGNFKFLGNVLIFIFTLLTILWGLAFFSIYTREQTRVSASRWIYQNVASGSKILGEHWDDGLPVPVGGFRPSLLRYDIEQLTIYEPDNELKLDYYAQKLPEGDYIVINSRRLYGTLINLPEKYPLTSRYYKLLFSEKLGYEKVAEFTSYPSFFGFEINDDASEETFQVYDHPKVIIFKNVEKLTPSQIRTVLEDEFT